MPRPLLILLLVAAAACGHKIGDSCALSSDCSQDGSRVCDTFSVGGYCTIRGCDYNTCPSEAVCVSFYPGVVATRCAGDGTCGTGQTCSPDHLCTSCSQQMDCAADQFCTIGGQCAPSSIEQRFCMLSCSSDGDCRDGYECRTQALMKIHGGEPVQDPTAPTAMVPDRPFCAPRRPCATISDCDTANGETCDPGLKVCVSTS
jgi:hypothetical protein